MNGFNQINGLLCESYPVLCYSPSERTEGTHQLQPSYVQDRRYGS